jgi:hypothetical protein
MRNLLGPLPSQASPTKTDARGKSYTKRVAKPRPRRSAGRVRG